MKTPRYKEVIMKFLPFCGKNPSNNATPIKVTANGELKTMHIWEGKWNTLLSESLRNTTAIVLPETALDISDYAIASLRIRSSLDASVTLTLMTDAPNSSGRWACDANGSAITISVPVTNNVMIITADDLPVLNHLKTIQLRVKADDVPTTGTLTVWAYTKR